MKMKRIISLALCFMLAFTLCQPVFAAGETITWTGESSDNWNVAGNWNPAQVPGMGDTAVVPASTVAAAVYDTTSVTLDCSGEVSVKSGKTLWLTGTSYLKGGKLSGDGNITIMVNDSELQWSGGSIEGNGTFTVEENTRLVIETGSDVGMSRPFENNGQVMLNSGDLLLMGGGTGTGTFTVSGGAYLHFEQGNYSIGGDFVNRGEMTIWPDSSVGFNADYWQEDESTLALKAGGTEAGEYCKLDVAGAAVLGGILEIDFISDYAPSPGDSFEIVTCGSMTGAFSEIRNNMEGITLVPTYTETGLTLTVPAASGNVCKIGATEYATLDAALTVVQSGETIELLQNIVYTNNSSSFAITIDGEHITFDLNGNNLTINNNSGYGVELKNRAKMTFTDSTGSGKLFIDTAGSGLSAGGGSTFESDGSVAVTINSRGGSGFSANNATVNIQDGSVSGNTHGVEANTNCMITVNGPVTVNAGVSRPAVYLHGPGNTVNVGNAIVTGGTGDGVSIRAGGTVTVGSSASPGSVIGKNAGIYTMGGTYPTQVTVYGNVEGVSYGICAFDNAEIEVYGDVTSTSTDTEACGVYTYAGSGPSSRIEIDGNVEGYDGMEVLGASSTARVTGNVTANGSNPNYATGVYAEDATAEVGGNLYAVSGTGAKAGKNGQITVDGSISAPKYIILRGTEKTIDDKTLPTTKEYYHTYNNDTATVWVKDSGTAEFAGGDGSEDNPYLIATADHLNNVRNHLNKHFRQTANINLSDYNSGEGWEPIGMSVDFTGSFDGGGHTISGLVINRPDQDDIGLFGYAETTAKIRNLGLVGVNVAGSDCVGGLVGGNRGQVTNSYVTGDVNGRGQVGGLVGNNYGAITESYAVGEVEGTDVVGGLVGFSSGNIDKSYATGTVTGTETGINYTYVGGLVGSNTGPISNSFARGAVSGEEDIGGLVGYNSGLITVSYSTGAVSGDSYIGGLVGFNHSEGTITGSYWDTETSSQTSSDGGTGKTTTAMKQKETFEHWDFITIWDMNADDNDGYPFLRWQNTEAVTAPAAPQTFIATPGDGQVALSWTAPASDGGRAITKYQVSKDNSVNWTDAGLNTSHTFTGLTNGTEYTFKVRAVNSVGSGAEASATATPTEYVCEIGAVKYTMLGQALEAATSGQTIKLLKNITHTSPILVDGKTIYFELGNYNLLVDTSDNPDESINYVLTVKNGGKVKLSGTGAGKLNVKSSSNCHNYGIQVLDANSEVTVDNIDATGESATGVYMYGSGLSLDGGTITVNGHLNAGSMGVKVNAKNGTVVINGDITAGHTGVQTATNPGTSVTVNGNITVLGTTSQDLEGAGILASGKTTVNVAGNVTGQGANYIGVYALGGTITVGGNVVSSGTGAKAKPNYSYGNGAVTIDSSLSAGTPFIIVGTTEKATADITDPTTKTGFLTYSDGISNVWIGSIGAPVVTAPAVPQNFAATPGDTQVDLSWTAPASDGGVPISGYQVSNDNGSTWVTASTSISHTFTGLTNGTAYTFKVRAINSAGNGAEASATATPATTYTVIVNGSYAATTGAGSYAQGATATISAGSRSSYTFAGWTSPDGVTFMNANNATTTFTMPDKNVTITANWSYNGSSGGSSGGGSSGGGSSGGGSSTPTTPTAPAYKADVKAENGTETTLPVTVDKDAGTASVDAGSQGLVQGETIITIPSIPDVDTYSVGIPVPDLSTSDIQGTLTVNTDAGNITVPSNMLAGVSGISGSKAEIAIGQGDKDNLPDTVKVAIGDRPLVQLTLSIDGKRTDWSNPNTPVTVRIPYTPTTAELANPESIVVWYIDGSGNVVSVPNGHYDPATGMVTFDTTHFSDYAVVYNKVSFNDVTVGAWYHKAVSFIAARGITGGTGNGNYSPNAKLTRGEFIVMLMKAYGIAPDANPNDNFSDAGGTYYTGYLAAAKRLSISDGVGNNMFAPEKEITRQEMFTLLYNALKAIGQLPQGDSGKTLDHFSDAGQIDSWAKEAMTLLVETGTIGGNAGKLNPTSTTTRAEMAQVLYNLLSK